MRRRTTAILITAAAGLASLALLAAGCGGGAPEPAASGSAPERQAAAAPTSCPEVSPSRTYGFEFRNQITQVVTLNVDPGWACVKGSGASVTAGYVGTSVPGALTGTQIAPGESVTRRLEFAAELAYARQGRFNLRFYAGAPPRLMRSVPMAFGGRRDGGGWWGFGTMQSDKPSEKIWTCRGSFPTALDDGTRVTITVDAYDGSCEDDPVRITITPAK